MSDSSEEEDLSRFREAVDPSFNKLIDETRGKPHQEHVAAVPKAKKSERFLEDSTHYNDVKVPEEMQKRIGDKVSALIKKKIEFVDVDQNEIKKHDVKGGVKLFKHSDGYLSWETAKDTYTEEHNIKSKKMKNKRRAIDNEDSLDEKDKVNAVAVSGEFVMSKEETKCWKSRRKEKIFKYKANQKNKVLVAVE